MHDAVRPEITRLLREYSPSDPDTAERLFEAIYPELRRLARSLMRREREGHTMQPTELAHDAYLKLVDQTAVLAKDRAHFLGIAARAMRQILVDHARRRRALKRGAVMERVTFNEMLGHGAREDVELLALDEALTTLAAKDERAARVVELRLFVGNIGSFEADRRRRLGPGPVMDCPGPVQRLTNSGPNRRRSASGRPDFSKL
jgi:RNA polymerase sigma-70 factor, ECF subfamily